MSAGTKLKKMPPMWMSVAQSFSSLGLSCGLAGTGSAAVAADPAAAEAGPAAAGEAGSGRT